MTSTAPVLRERAPSWAGADEAYDVREVAGDKPYICPGCDHPIRPGTMAQVKIHCRWRTCAWWLWWTINSTFDLGLI